MQVSWGLGCTSMPGWGDPPFCCQVWLSGLALQRMLYSARIRNFHACAHSALVACGSMLVAPSHLAVLATVPALAALAVPARHCVSSSTRYPVTCRVKMVYSSEEEAAAARAAEEGRPSASAQAHRAAGGQYTAEQPFWATITDAQYLSATWSDRKVRTGLTLHCSDTALV